jgi:hypothetical protein
MNKAHKIVSIALLGGIIAWLVWLAIYLAHKTPAIEFDGPAGFGMIISTGAGILIFGVIGIVLVRTRRF